MTAKPFIKWVGGKNQLIEQLDQLLPDNFEGLENVMYIEPFLGGGAMLFYMLQKYPNITTAIVNDINPDLTNCYQVVRDYPDELVNILSQLQEEFHKLNSEEERKDYYLTKRSEYNTKNVEQVRNAALFIFLNKTCFNGLYRVNKKGIFNVPFGRQTKPTICDSKTIYADSALLKRVKILTGSYTETIEHAHGNVLFYFDPPYRPLNATSSFNDYAKEEFNDAAQTALKEFCDLVHEKGYYFMLSNSDCSSANPNDTFFEDLYLPSGEYNMERVLAARSINSVGSKRGKITEIVVRNYSTTNSQSQNKQQLSLF